MNSWNDKAYALFEEQQQARGIDLDAVKTQFKALKIETPSWGYGDSGTRFKVFKKVGVPRNPYEKLDDAAIVNNLTGACPKVAIHIPWDKVDDYEHLKNHAKSLGLTLGAVNPNLFQDDVYMLGSVCNSDARIRKKATDHLLECVEIMKQVDSDVLSLWFADGTNYPGQGSFRARKQWLFEALLEAYQKLAPNMRMLIEYKMFEPGFYHTDLADWGTAFLMATKLGTQAQVLVDLGHHALGTNVEHIVATLLDEEKLGGFHFNSRKYADDDLIVGTTNPYELFLIFAQILDAAHDSQAGIVKTANEIAYMIDQSHAIEPKIPATLRSVINIQTQYAKALLIDTNGLRKAQENNDVLRAEAIMKEAFEFDVSVLLRVIREEAGLPVDLIQAFYDSGYQESIANRGIGGASW